MSGYVPPCFPFVLGTGQVVERFISFDVPVLSHVFGYGNKLLTWPKTNLTVSFMFSLAGGNCYRSTGLRSCCHNASYKC